MRILLLNQCFYPDVVSTAQHLTDLALGLAQRGHEVTVVASDRGYDNPAIRFPRREEWKGITIIRLATFGLGKGAKWQRAVTFASFLTLCALRMVRLPRFDLVVALTSPPLISLLGSLFVRIKGGRLISWVMDLNPDEAVAAGWLKPTSITARMLSSLLRYSLLHSDCVIALDRFMKERILRYGVPDERISVSPPWAHDDSITFDEKGRRLFRDRHTLREVFVVMYSGNHSPCHPLDTLLEAALRLEEKGDIAFCFVGGGSEQTKVKAFAAQHKLDNITTLPYQPYSELSGSLSAADLHVVVMGDEFAGIVHPCKVYNILAVGRPFLYIGPQESHISDIVSQSSNGLAYYSARHGEVNRVVSHILEASRRRTSLGGHSRSDLPNRFAKRNLLPRIIELMEKDGQSEFQTSSKSFAARV